MLDRYVVLFVWSDIFRWIKGPSDERLWSITVSKITTIDFWFYQHTIISNRQPISMFSSFSSKDRKMISTYFLYLFIFFSSISQHIDVIIMIMTRRMSIYVQREVKGRVRWPQGPERNDSYCPSDFILLLFIILIFHWTFSSTLTFSYLICPIW